MLPPEHDPKRWTPQLPARPGWYEIHDAQRDVRRIIRVFEARNGELAVANVCPCKRAFYLRMWLLPCFQMTLWRGPVMVPDALPEEVSAGGPEAGLCRSSRGCLLGEHDDLTRGPD